MEEGIEPQGRSGLRTLALCLFIIIVNAVGFLFFDIAGGAGSFFLSGLSFVFCLDDSDGWEKKFGLALGAFCLGGVALLAVMLIKFYAPDFSHLNRLWHNWAILGGFISLYLFFLLGYSLCFIIGWVLSYWLKSHSIKTASTAPENN